MIYVLAIAVAVFIVFRARALFMTVEQKEGEVESLIDSIRGAFEGLKESSQSIYDSLQFFHRGAGDGRRDNPHVHGEGAVRYRPSGREFELERIVSGKQQLRHVPLTGGTCSR